MTAPVITNHPLISSLINSQLTKPNIMFPFSMVPGQLWQISLQTHFMGKDKGEVRKAHFKKDAPIARNHWLQQIAL